MHSSENSAHASSAVTGSSVNLVALFLFCFFIYGMAC